MAQRTRANKRANSRALAAITGRGWRWRERHAQADCAMERGWTTPAARFAPTRSRAAKQTLPRTCARVTGSAGLRPGLWLSIVRLPDYGPTLTGEALSGLGRRTGSLPETCITYSFAHISL